ncbi:MAG: cytochrome c3 family protein [Desulfuromonadaceae bacterium]|nr:cytochrome c3 family protein [Desulfuromonadaceae bacterium]
MVKLDVRVLMCLRICIVAVALLSATTCVYAGAYATSAHGDPDAGVLRSSIPEAYIRGNCAHCHEQHASVGGVQPSPANATVSGFALFSTNFSGRMVSPYTQEDNFCFQCHTVLSSHQVGGSILNHDYAETFGGYDEGTDEGILEQFNHSSGMENSYHNLRDIQKYAADNFDWFKEDSNPCVACHNPHRARRNKNAVDNPVLTAISRPTDHENLWGDTPGETMAGYRDYLPPYFYNSVTRYEPGGKTYPDSNLVPDYSTFCNDCHAVTMPLIYSTELGRNLIMIDWSSAAEGDKHGQSARTGETWLREPYASGNKSNYVLSCLDCHEPHGSPYPFLVRRSINGEPLHLTSDVNDGRGNQCRQCHKDDSLLGTGDVNDWKLQHHGQGQLSPYSGSQVSGCGCHYAEGSAGGGGRPPAIRCEICHYHGSFVPNPAGEWPATAPLKNGGTRKTF